MMTESQISTLNADILRNLGAIAEDEGMLKRAARYLRRLVKEMNEDSTLMTKEEFLQRVDEAQAQYDRGEYTTQLPGESISDMLKRCGYAL